MFFLNFVNEGGICSRFILPCTRYHYHVQEKGGAGHMKQKHPKRHRFGCFYIKSH